MAEVFGLDPLNLAVALDDDRQVVFPVMKHCVSSALREGVIDSLPVLPHDPSDVFAPLNLHAVPCRLTVSQTSLS
jgi:hypothetical protein